jgi:signal transduction histidine kinase
MELETLFRLLINSSREAYYVFNRAGEIIEASATASKETEYEDFAGVNISSVFPALVEIKDGKFRWLDEAVENTDILTSAYRKNSTCYPVIARVIKKDYLDGCGFIISSDYSEEKAAITRTRQAIEEMQYGIKMRTEFMANVTHELRTPVNGMKGMAENLLDTQLSPSQTESIEIIIRNCNNMSKIINDILDFSKIEAGHMTLENRKFNFRQMIDNIMTMHLQKTSEKGLKLIANISPDVPNYIVGDEVRISQVINNLIGNAIKFTSVGYIALEVSVNNRTASGIELFFMVVDTGIGISDDQKANLFKAFTQADGSITRRFGGTGLGLTISKQIVELMGGSIRVEGEKGKGSTFSFTINVEEAEKESEDEEYSGPSGRYEYSRDLKDDSFGYRSIGDDEELVDEQTNLFNAKDALEKMKLCVELGTWEKAEDFSDTIKNMIPADNQELKRLAFRLELCARKEDYDQTVKLMAELEEKLAGM